MPEMLQVHLPTQPSKARGGPQEHTEYPAQQVNGALNDLPTRDTTLQLGTSKQPSDPRATPASTNAPGPTALAPTTIRGRLDDSIETSLQTITLPSPQALGLLGPEQRESASERKTRPVAAGTSRDALPSPSGSAPAGQYVRPFDWAAVRQKCEGLGATSCRLEKLADGRWRFTFVLPSRSHQAERELEAIADSEADAVEAVLQHLQGNAPIH